MENRFYIIWTNYLTYFVYATRIIQFSDYFPYIDSDIYKFESN